MISVAQLRKACADALEYVRAQEDVDEVEVFVSSNGNLLTRLNYTSHIPCNGVEEPKSTEDFGIGVRAVFRTPEGRKVGFGSESADITLRGAQEALAKARKGAVLDPEFVSLPEPIPGLKRTLRRYHDPQLMRIRDDHLVDAGWAVTEGALRTYLASEELRIAAEGGDIAQLGLILGGDVTILQERMAIASTHMPRVQTDESTLIMAFITSMVEKRDAKGSGYWAGTRLAEFGDEAGRQAARSAIAQMGGVRVPSGRYRVVLGRQAVMDILVNILLPNLNLGLFYMAGSTFLGKFGQQVGWERLSVYDDAARPGLVGSKGITDEGLPTGRTDLIRDGVLVGLLSNDYEARRISNDPKAREKLGVEPREYATGLMPRNGFRFARGGGRHFDAAPGIYGTNIFIESSEPLTHEELLRRVGDGLYIGRIWYTYPINGLKVADFTCTVVGDSYVIRDGRLAEPIKANTIRINDNIHNVINRVIGITADARPTLVWAADEIVHAPEIGVDGLEVQEIASFMESV